MCSLSPYSYHNESCRSILQLPYYPLVLRKAWKFECPWAEKARTSTVMMKIWVGKYEELQRNACQQWSLHDPRCLPRFMLKYGVLHSLLFFLVHTFAETDEAHAFVLRKNCVLQIFSALYYAQYFNSAAWRCFNKILISISQELVKDYIIFTAHCWCVLNRFVLKCLVVVFQASPKLIERFKEREENVKVHMCCSVRVDNLCNHVHSLNDSFLLSDWCL